MGPHKHSFLGIPIALDQGNMVMNVHNVFVNDHLEIAAETGRQIGLDDAAHKGLLGKAVFNYIGNRYDMNIVLGCELFKLRHARHGAVFIHDLTDNARGLQPCHTAQVGRAFRLPGPPQHAALHGLQRKNMARAAQIFRLCSIINAHPYGIGAVGGRYARCCALARVNRHGEGGLKLGRVVSDHQRQIKLLAPLFRERHADQAAAVLGHEINGLRGCLLGCHGKIAFVFPVLIIGQYNHSAASDLIDCLFYSFNLYRHLLSFR